MIKRAHYEVNYTQILNEVIIDEQLDPYAFRIFAYLIGKPSDWTTIHSDVAKKLHMNVKTVSRCMEDLVKAGYATRGNRIMKDGHLAEYDYTVFSSKNEKDVDIRPADFHQTDATNKHKSENPLAYATGDFATNKEETPYRKFIIQQKVNESKNYQSRKEIEDIERIDVELLLQEEKILEVNKVEILKKRIKDYSQYEKWLASKDGFLISRNCCESNCLESWIKNNPTNVFKEGVDRQMADELEIYQELKMNDLSPSKNKG
jgi:hypothetical protein